MSKFIVFYHSYGSGIDPCPVSIDDNNESLLKWILGRYWFNMDHVITELDSDDGRPDE